MTQRSLEGKAQWHTAAEEMEEIRMAAIFRIRRHENLQWNKEHVLRYRRIGNPSVLNTSFIVKIKTALSEHKITYLM